MDTFLCPDVRKTSNFRQDALNQQLSVQVLDYVLKRATIEPVIYKKAMKYENIGCGVFLGTEGAEKNLTP